MGHETHREREIKPMMVSSRVAGILRVLNNQKRKEKKREERKRYQEREEEENLRAGVPITGNGWVAKKSCMKPVSYRVRLVDEDPKHMTEVVSRFVKETKK